MLLCLGFVNANAQITIALDITEPTCFGYTNGQATATPTGGTAPYQYFWNTGTPNATAYNLGAGSYGVTVSDANGLTASATAIVNEPAQIQVSIDPMTDICLGTEDTWIANVTGGTPPYNYIWSTGATDTLVSNLSMGFLFVTVTDAAGCQGIGGMKVNDPLSIIVTATDVICFGICDASVEIQLMGGVGPYTYLWNTGSTDPSLPWVPAGDYSVTITDANGCTVTGSATSNEPPEIMISATIDGQCSNNASITVNPSGGTPPFSYFWGFNGSTSNTVSNLGPGSYNVVVTDSNNCQKDSTFIISPGITIDIIDIVNPTCLGGANGMMTAIVTSPGVTPYTFEWSNGTNTAANINLDPGTYTVTATDNAGCTATASATIVATSDLELVVTSTDVNCDGTGGTATVSDVINGTPGYSYEWNTTPPQFTATAINLDAGTYTVTVIDTLGCMAMDTVSIASPVDLIVMVQVTDASCEDSSDGSITVTDVGPNAIPPLTYVWSHDSNLNAAIANDLLPGIYSVTVTDSIGCSGTAVDLELGFNSSIASNIEWVIDTCMGDSILVTFSENSILTPTDATIVSWDWTFSTGLTSSDSTVQFYTTTDSIDVTLIVQNSFNCTDTVSETVIFDLLCDVYSDTVFVCQGDTLQLEPNADCTNITAFEWLPDSVIIAGQNTSTPTIIGTNNMFLEVNVSNGIGCSLVETVFVEVIDTSKQIQANEITYSQCDSTTLDFATANADIACFTWYFDYPNDVETGSGMLVSHTYPAAGDYVLALVPNVPCLDTVFIDITVEEVPNADFTVDLSPCTDVIDVQLMDNSTVPTQITAWEWTLSTGDTSSLQNPVFTFDSCQTVETQLVIFFDPNCTDTSTMIFDVPVFENPPELVDTLIVCEAGDTISLNVGGDTNFEYNWSPDNLLDDPTAVNPLATVNATTLFTVTITDDGCADTCSVELQVLVIVADTLGLIIPGDVGVCEVIDTTLTATTTVPAMIQWSIDPNFDSIYEQSDTLVTSHSIAFTVADTTMMYVKATDAYGCMDVDSFLLAYYGVEAIVQDFINICIGDTLVSMPIENLTVNDNVVWEPSSPMGTVPTENGAFTVTITNDQNCELTQTIDLNVQDISLNLNVIPALDTILLGQSAQITATIDEDYVYNWTPSDGSLDDTTIADPTATPDTETIYLLEVQDTVTGCRGTGTSIIWVGNDLCDDPMIDVPNTFTPNGDGLNDVFYVRGFNIDEVQMVVYNRWGQKMFETRDVNKGWDGSFEGQRLPPDAYAYYLRVVCIEGGVYEKTGNVTIIR